MNTLNNYIQRIQTYLWVNVTQKVWWLTTDKYPQPGKVWNIASLTFRNPFAASGLNKAVVDLATVKTYAT